MPPPFQEGWVQQDGAAVTRELYDTMTQMLAHMNKVVAGLTVLDPVS